MIYFVRHTIADIVRMLSGEAYSALAINVKIKLMKYKNEEILNLHFHA